MTPEPPLGHDPDWSLVEQLLLRAETLLHASADSLDRRREEREQQQERIARGLDDLRRPLTQLRRDVIDLVEAMADEAASGHSLPWQARLQEQLPQLERALIELDRLLVEVADPPDPVNEEGIRPRLAHLEFQEMLEQRNQQVIELRAEVQRLEAIVQAAGLSLSAGASQESGSM